MKTLFPLLTLLFFSFSLMAQVGINTPTPDSNSVLDLKSKTKGLLIPRMTTVQREGMSSVKFSQGMMVYDITLDILFVGYGNGALSTKWYAMNPWKTEYRKGNNASKANMTTMTVNPSSLVGDSGVHYGNVGIGVPNPTKKLEVKDAIKTDTIISVVVNAVSGNGITPLGGIIMWSGTKAPSGWALCNGLTVNGYKTPDLRGRFIVGYDNGVADYNNPGDLSTKGTTGSVDVGGKKEVVLTEAQMPRHNHTMQDAGIHTHGYYDRYNNLRRCDQDNERNCNDLTDSYRTTQPAGLHKHTINYNGSSQAHENRPPYYTLAYIMRVE